MQPGEEVVGTSLAASTSLNTNHASKLLSYFPTTRKENSISIFDLKLSQLSGLIVGIEALDDLEPKEARKSSKPEGISMTASLE